MTHPDAPAAVAALLNTLTAVLDHVREATPHRDGHIHLDPAAVDYHLRRLEILSSRVAALAVPGLCTPFVPHCMGRAAASECTCKAPPLVIPRHARVSRRSAATVAPHRRTPTGRLLVAVPDKDAPR